MLTELCIYTIKHSDDLRASLANDCTGTFTEGKEWVRGKKLLDDAKRTGKRLPVIFAPAEGTRFLFAWALLDEVVLGEKTTTYKFSELIPFDSGRLKSRLVKDSNGQRLDDDYIRGYAVCLTPDDLIELPATGRTIGDKEDQPPNNIPEIEPPATGRTTGDKEEQAPNNVPEFVWRQIRDRRGQGPFRSKLLRAYQTCCAVTGCDAESALEAAHIIPHAESGSQDVTSGLLLRADIHTLFDLHLIRIEPESHEVILAEELKGTSYADLAGKKIRLPKNTNEWPNKEALQAHWALSGDDRK